MYDLNKPYQALLQYHPGSVAAVKMKDPAFFKECIGNLDYYPDFVRFFQDEIAEKGVPQVVNEYLFKGDELTDDILARMHSGENIPKWRPVPELPSDTSQDSCTP